MAEQNNTQTPAALNPEVAQGFTAERVLRTRPKTYRAIVQLLADPHASVNQIAKFHRVSTHTVRPNLVCHVSARVHRKENIDNVVGQCPAIVRKARRAAREGLFVVGDQ